MLSAMRETPRRRITVTSSLSEMSTYLKTTWTAFPPHQIFASCSQLSTPINTSAYQLGLKGNSLLSQKCEIFSKWSNFAKMLKPTLSFQSIVLSPLTSHHGGKLVLVCKYMTAKQFSRKTLAVCSILFWAIFCLNEFISPCVTWPCVRYYSIIHFKTDVSLFPIQKPIKFTSWIAPA